MVRSIGIVLNSLNTGLSMNLEHKKIATKTTTYILQCVQITSSDLKNFQDSFINCDARFLNKPVFSKPKVIVRAFKRDNTSIFT